MAIDMAGLAMGASGLTGTMLQAYKQKQEQERRQALLDSLPPDQRSQAILAQLSSGGSSFAKPPAGQSVGSPVAGWGIGSGGAGSSGGMPGGTSPFTTGSAATPPPVPPATGGPTPTPSLNPSPNPGAWSQMGPGPAMRAAILHEIASRAAPQNPWVATVNPAPQ